MSRPRIALMLALVLLAAPARPAPAGEDDLPRLPFEAYELANGLQVVLHQDRRLPVACVNIWYRVGAKDELPGRTGFAHLFEHLMFMGTERVPQLSFDTLMEAEGGSNNASTSLDRTNYFESGPSHLLPTLLWLEAERMEAMGPSMTQEKLALQQNVVREERRQSYEIAPYGPAYLALYENLYPRGHPYRHSVIGTHEDIQAATVQDVKDFHRRFHAPNNASLVVAGDFDVAEVKGHIERLFGSLPRGEDPHRPLVPAVDLAQAKRVTVPDPNVELAQLLMAFHSPPYFANGDSDLDIVASVLTEGKTSRLYRRLVFQDKLATEVAAWQGSAQLGSLFNIQATATPGTSLEALEAAVWDEITRLQQDGPTPEELRRITNRIEMQKIAGLESLQERADLLNHYLYWLGRPDGLAQDLLRYRRATPDSVRTWCVLTLQRSRGLVVRTVPTPSLPEGSRDVRPGAAPRGRFEPPVAEAFRLPSGLEVWHVQRPGLPLVSLRLESSAGSMRDPAGKSGLSALANDMLDEGAGALDSLAYAQALEDLAAQLVPVAEREAAGLAMSVLKRNLAPALDLFAAALVRPTLADADLERVRALRLAALEQEEADPTELARRIAGAAWWGGDHPYGRPGAGHKDELAALTAEDVRSFIRSHYRPSGCRLYTAGDIDRPALEALLAKAFAGWEDAPRVAVPAIPPAAGRGRGLRVLVHDMPDAPQTVLRVVFPAAGYASPDRLPLGAVNTLLGGSFTSRLNANLREAKGWTYGIGSGLALLAADGAWVASSSVRASVTVPAVKEVLGERSRMAAGDISAEEAKKASASLMQGMVDGSATLEGLLAELAEAGRKGRGPEALAQDVQAMQAGWDAAALNDVARRALAAQDVVVVLVGDRATILGQLEGAGLPAPVLVNARCEPLEAAAPAGR
ncbi:MAG: M16 family metallopeptidase [Planctomycetia bacterium]